MVRAGITGNRRIMFAITSFAGGGAERQLAYLAGRLGALGWDISVLFSSAGPNLDRIREPRVRLRSLGGTGAYDPGVIPRIVREMSAWRPHLVQSWLPAMDISCGIAARLAGVPWVMSERNSAECYRTTWQASWRHSWKHELRCLLARRAGLCVANSLGGAELWRAQRVASVVVPNGLPLEEIDAAPPLCADGQPRWQDGGALRVLGVGRLHESKNFATLIAALARLSGRRAVQALICGEGSEQAALERAIADAGMKGRIVLAGYVPETRLWTLMKSAQLVVTASRYEGNPNTVLEGMACRTPTISSEIPAHREVLDGGSALWFACDDHAGLALRIEELIADPAATRARVERARRFAELRSVQRMVGHYDRVFRTVLERSSGAPA
jgi:glycosyltransferase involved in cell wall biosynthesis